MKVRTWIHAARTLTRGTCPWLEPVQFVQTSCAEQYPPFLMVSLSDLVTNAGISTPVHSHQYLHTMDVVTCLSEHTVTIHTRMQSSCKQRASPVARQEGRDTAVAMDFSEMCSAIEFFVQSRRKRNAAFCFLHRNLHVQHKLSPLGRCF